ncbi:O-antigen ligase family protein, partial [bacterium]|nr:O-antigen ligase family protein [bacterium]
TIEGVRLSFSFIVKICSYFLLLQFIRNEKELTKSIKMIMIGAGLATLLAIYQQYAFISGGMPKLKTVMMEGAVSGLNYNFPYAPLRPLAGMNHSAAFGSYLTFPLALLLGIFFFRMPLKYRLWALIPTILMFLVLVMNDTRAAYFSILISFLICMMLGNNKLRYSLFVLLMMAPILIVPVYEFLFFHRETSVATRQEVLPIVFEFALQNPLGGGILFFQKTNEMQLGAHSSFLQMLTFGGIPAMLIYLYILVSIFFQFRKSFNGIWSIRDNYPMRYAFIIILSAIFVGALITSELVHPRTTNKDHWAFLAIFFLTPLFSEAAVEDEKRIKFENST